MYTSGTTGDPKGVLISNNSIVTLIAGVKRLLECANEAVNGYLFLIISDLCDVNLQSTVRLEFLERPHSLSLSLSQFFGF